MDDHSLKRLKDEVKSAADSLGHISINEHKDIMAETVQKDSIIRKEHEINLDERDKSVRCFFDIVEDIIFIITPEGIILHANKAVTERLGYAIEDLIGTSIFNYYPKTYKSRAEKILHRMLNDEVELTEIPLQKKDTSLLRTETRILFGMWGDRQCIYSISKDITKQQMALQKFYKLFDSNPAIMAVVGAHNDKFIDINMAFVEMLGYDPEEVFGHTSEELGLFEDKLQEQKIKEEVYKYGSIHNYEIKLRKRDKSILEGLLSAEIINNHGVKSLLIVIVDQTQQKQVENELKASEMRLNTATNNAKVGLWEWHIKTDSIYFNEQWASLVGYTLEEITPTDVNTWFEFAHPEDLVHSEAKISECCLGKTEYYECEVRLKHKNGEWIWVLDRGKVAEWGENGEPLLMIGTCINIDHIKKVEQELLDEKSKKERILSAVALSIKELLGQMDYLAAAEYCFHILGEATGVDRVYLFQNEYDEAGNGITNQKIEWTAASSAAQINNPALQGVHFEDIETFISPLIKGKPFYGIVRELECGRTRELLELQDIKSVAVLPVYVRGVFWGFLGFDECQYERVWNEAEFSMLSAFANSLEKAIERRLIEEELEKSKKEADEANAAKSMFIANMSHEIRTPINGILGMIDLLAKSDISNEQKVYIDLLRNSTESLVNIINDILDLSKIESGSMELILEPFEVRQSIYEVIKMIQPLMDNKELNLKVAISKCIPTYLLGDFEKIKQVLLNLLSNAIKFTSKGSIEVSIDGKQRDDRLFEIEFCVSDTGIGISGDKMKNIFEPFVQADNTVSKRYGGTGLGLSICQKLIEMMKGHISVQSTAGEGTKAAFVIPLEEPLSIGIVEQKSQCSNIEPRLKRALHILIVEDNEVNQLLVSKFLRKGNHTFEIASNGKEAIELFEKEKFDAVLMDVQMPEMDGYTATRLIRQGEKDSHTPIIALTAHAMKGDAERCKDAGMNYYLAKPIYFDKLQALLIEIFGEEQPFEPIETLNVDYAEMVFQKLDSDKTFFSLITNKLKTSSLELIKEIREGILNKNGEQLRNAAHALKGAVSAFEAVKAAELAKELEMMGRSRSFEKADSRVNQLEHSIKEILICFHEFMKHNNFDQDVENV